METLIIVGHPQIQNSTTQQFFKEGLTGFNHVEWHPISTDFDVAQERQALLRADRILLQFPLYWYSAPALLKRWLDDVWSVNQLNLSGKELGLVVTTGDAAKNFRAGGAEGYSMSEVLRPFEMLAHRLQLTYLPALIVYQFAYMNPTDQQELLIRYQQYVTNPNFASFAGQIKWFEEQLTDRISQTPDLAKILKLIEENEELRTDLEWNLDPFKQED